jgi:NAD(P)-dependent dehydrogenase (short-subunit alcohol dehydrogenase family)
VRPGRAHAARRGAARRGGAHGADGVPARDAAPRRDFDSFRDRLRIGGLDLRHLDAVERFAATLADEVPYLDILVNNAAQTVRRPAGWWEALVAGALRGPAALAAARARR